MSASWLRGGHLEDIAGVRRPCSNCPWRRDAPREHWAPEHFEQIAVNCRDDGMHVMMCHKSNALPKAQRASRVCQGWVRVMGFEAIGVRIATMTGRVTKEEVEDRGGPVLFESFDEMLLANRIKAPKRNRSIDVEEDVGRVPQEREASVGQGDRTADDDRDRSRKARRLQKRHVP